MPSDLDLVRLKIGDTDEDDPLLVDDEIDACLGMTDSVTAAAAEAAMAIAAKFARGFNFSTDGQSFNRSERVAHYTALSRQLGLAAGSGSVSVPVKSSVAAAVDDGLTLGE